MGRKKKTIESEKEIKIETPVNSFAYTGKINVSLKRGNKTCFSKQFKNKGRWPLFHFLNVCLSGNYSSADAFRPRYINAFGNQEWEGKVEPVIDDSGTPGTTMIDYFNLNTKKTVSSIPYLSIPDVETIRENVQIGSSFIKYKFNIPFSQIVDKEHINAFALYAAPINNSGDLNKIEQPCVFFFLKDENNNVINLLNINPEDPIIPDSEEYSIYIEWKLSVGNK